MRAALMRFFLCRAEKEVLMRVFSIIGQEGHTIEEMKQIRGIVKMTIRDFVSGIERRKTPKNQAELINFFESMTFLGIHIVRKEIYFCFEPINTEIEATIGKGYLRITDINTRFDDTRTTINATFSTNIESIDDDTRAIVIEIFRGIFNGMNQELSFRFEADRSLLQNRITEIRFKTNLVIPIDFTFGAPTTVAAETTTRSDL
ncbi:hypothetical protein JW911_04340 [Candidatus Peregrinibacteria bacterium]|nr:hypothetical protein [Candidatus Peregrinibacteria bacterium]